jgi:hypothetical protein
LVSILREDVTQQLEEVSQDEKVAISRGSESEPGVNIIAKLFKESASSTGERSHHVAEALTPASLDHGVLESHFVDLFGEGDACQVCEQSRKFLARGLHKSVQAIIARLWLNSSQFRIGPYQLDSVTFYEWLTLGSLGPRGCGHTLNPEGKKDHYNVDALAVLSQFARRRVEFVGAEAEFPGLALTPGHTRPSVKIGSSVAPRCEGGNR